MRPYRVLGVDIADQTMREALDHLAALVAGEGPRSLFFVNAHTLNHAAADPDYRAVLNRASRVWGDGTGVRWAASWRGVRLQANLNGTDLVPAFLDRSEGLRCFLVGGTPESVERTLAGARRRFPAIEFVGAHHGFLDEAASRELCARIEASGARLVLVGMGNPLQERWIDRHGSRMPGALCVAVGGLFSYWNGELVRAPAAFRRLGMEWLHLMLRQPRKVPRYLLGNPLYMARAALRARRERPDRPAGATGAEAHG